MMESEPTTATRVDTASSAASDASSQTSAKGRSRLANRISELIKSRKLKGPSIRNTVYEEGNSYEYGAI